MMYHLPLEMEWWGLSIYGGFVCNDNVLHTFFFQSTSGFMTTPSVLPNHLAISPAIFFCKMSCRSMWGFLYMPSFLSFGDHFPLVIPLIVIHWRILKAFMSIFLHHLNSSLHASSCLHWVDINHSTIFPWQHKSYWWFLSIHMSQNLSMTPQLYTMLTNMQLHRSESFFESTTTDHCIFMLFKMNQICPLLFLQIKLLAPSTYASSIP